MAVSYEGVTRYSADGDRWEPAHKVPPLDTLHDVAWGNGRYVGGGKERDHHRQSVHDRRRSGRPHARYRTLDGRNESGRMGKVVGAA